MKYAYTLRMFRDIYIKMNKNFLVIWLIMHIDFFCVLWYNYSKA